MHIRCPSCGAQMSLDAVVDDNSAARALTLALELHPLGCLLIRYLALFRPAKSKLSWPRVATLLDELLPSIQQQRLERDSRTHDVPLHAWGAALEKTLTARDTGALRTPLKTHGYLFEVAIVETARAQAAGVLIDQGGSAAPARPLSSTAQAIARLEERKQRGGQ